MNRLLCCANNRRNRLLEATRKAPESCLFPVADLFAPTGSHLRRVQRIRSQRHCTRLQSKCFEIDHFKRCESHIFLFQFCNNNKKIKVLRVSRGGIHPPPRRAGRLGTERNPGDFLSVLREEEDADLLFPVKRPKSSQLEVHLVMKLEPRKRREKKKKVSAFFCGRI